MEETAPEIRTSDKQVTSTAYFQENWSDETLHLPKQFSFINIVEHAKKSGRKLSSDIENLLKRITSFSLKTIAMKFMLKGSVIDAIRKVKNLSVMVILSPGG